MGQIPEHRLKAYMRMSDLEDSRDFSFPDIRGWKVLSTTGHEEGKVEEFMERIKVKSESRRERSYKNDRCFDLDLATVPCRLAILSYVAF